MTIAKFRDRVESHQSATPAMTLAHTTNAENLHHILNDDAVKPIKNFRGTPTLYFFYGVNFYRQPVEFNDATSKPVGFLFKNEVLEQAKSVFPFDTGAHENKLYGRYLHDDVLEYEVPIVSEKTPAKLVNLLYESNDDYLFGNPKRLKLAKTLKEHEIINFVKNATTTIGHPDKFDDRCFAIEVQFIEEQEFKKNVELLILPRYTYEEELKGLLEGKLEGIKIEYYDDIPISGPNGNSILIRQKAMDYLRTEGIIK